MAVKFLKPYPVGTLYNEGEVAGFDADTEEALVKAKIAESVKTKAASKS